jgi:hypothetical protein
MRQEFDRLDALRGPGFIYVRKQRPADLVRLVAAIREIAAG